jgi:hypothetical protein
MLFIAGDEPNSSRARQNLDRILSTRFNGRVGLEVVNVLEDFRKAVAHGVFITPALVVMAPVRGATIYGDLSDEEQVIATIKPAILDPNG